MNENIINRFKRYVQINSESGNEKEFSKVLIEELKALGFTVKQDQLTEAHRSNTSNIIAILEGEHLEKSILLCAHMDTVTPGKNIIPKEINDRITSEGKTILGADDKAGVAIIMDALSRIVMENANHMTVEVVFTVHEEAGLYGSRALDFSMIKSDKAIVLDSSGEVGGIIIKAPSKEKISASVKGKSSHAGIAPEKGINAIAVASEAISKMKLSNVDKDTTANIGTFSGGDATNIVPDEVNVTGEVRSFKEKKLNKQINHMKECIDDSIDKYNADGEITTEHLYKGYQIDKNDPLIHNLIMAGKKAGIEMFTRDSKGGSDANIFNENNITTVNLAIGTEEAHSTNEYIKKESLYKGSDIIYNFLKLKQ